jgi:hypothetical protein
VTNTRAKRKRPKADTKFSTKSIVWFRAFYLGRPAGEFLYAAAGVNAAQFTRRSTSRDGGKTGNG